MLHLTYTGYHAGRILCGADKSASVADGNNHLHAIYFDLNEWEGDPRRISHCYAEQEICLACVEVLREVAREDAV